MEVRHGAGDGYQASAACVGAQEGCDGGVALEGKDVLIEIDVEREAVGHSWQGDAIARIVVGVNRLQEAKQVDGLVDVQCRAAAVVSGHHALSRGHGHLLPIQPEADLLSWLVLEATLSVGHAALGCCLVGESSNWRVDVLASSGCACRSLLFTAAATSTSGKDDGDGEASEQDAGGNAKHGTPF